MTSVRPAAPNQPLADAAHPVLLNSWKHHAGSLRRRLALVQDVATLERLPEMLVVMGTELMDLYTGALSPKEIGIGVVSALSHAGRLAPAVFDDWVAKNGGYQVITLSDDGSSWVLRMGDPEGNYVHVHPARWAPLTLRVRANVLKTAVMALAYVGVHGGNPFDVAIVNEVRRRYLSYSPIRALTGEQGIRAVINLLRVRD
jgi:hypothetical protein